jgi:hypothetical protein
LLTGLHDLRLGLARRPPEMLGQRADGDAEIGGAAGVARMIDIAALVPEGQREGALEIR